MIKFVIPIFLLLVLYFPINSYSQNTESDEFSGMTFSGNTTGVIKKDLPLNPNQFWYFLLLSFIIILGITIIVERLIKQNNDKRKRKINFIDLIKDGDYYPSLPRFQFLIWTFVISFVYLSIYLIRIFSGEFDAPAFDNNLLILLGISILSPILGNVISGYKYTTHVSETPDDGDDPMEIERKSFKTMLFENGKPALFRYQMFLWTFIGVTIFLSLFAAGISEYIHKYQECISIVQCITIDALAMPKIDTMLVTLMGLSQSGYLGGKIVARTPARITKMFPGTKNKFIILGLNFGERNEISSGTILINNKVVAGHTDNEVKWFDTKIEFPIEGEEYKNKSFKLGIIIDDVIFLEQDYIFKDRERNI